MFSIVIFITLHGSLYKPVYAAPGSTRHVQYYATYVVLQVVHIYLKYLSDLTFPSLSPVQFPDRF